MGRSEQPKTVMTIARNGIQLTRSFTVLLRPDPRFPVHNKTIIYGALTINILDTSSMCYLKAVIECEKNYFKIVFY